MLHILSTTIFAHKKYLQKWNTLCDKKIANFCKYSSAGDTAVGARRDHPQPRDPRDQEHAAGPLARRHLRAAALHRVREQRVTGDISAPNIFAPVRNTFYCRPTSRPTSRRSRTPRGGSSSGSVTRQRCSCCGSRPSRPATTPTTRCVDIHVDIYG